jgi:hypothetical protein
MFYHICYHIGYLMFHPEKEFNRIIFESLGKDGKSISSLSKELEEKGYKFHRLILTGYLRALTDMKVLREKEVPPAKIYSPLRPVQRNVYDLVMEKAHTISSGRDADRLVIFALCNLFKRPLFEEEIERMGIDLTAGEPAMKEDADDARKALNRRQFKIPRSARAYVPSNQVDKEDYVRLMEELLVENLDLSHLVVGTRQLRLY